VRKKKERKKKRFSKDKKKETIKERKYHEGEAWESRLSLQGGRVEGRKGGRRVRERANSFGGQKTKGAFPFPKMI